MLFMLRKIRITLASVFFICITLLFADFTGTLHVWFGWMAKIQFFPALLALNAIIVIATIVITIVFGRIYCSVICPLGVFQDIVSWFSNKHRKNRFRYSKSITWLRWSVLALFIIAFIAGIHLFVALLEPYSSYGRIVSNLVAPVYHLGNNIMAYLAERVNSYAFYSTNIWVKSLSTIAVAAVTFIVIFILAWRNGRTYCNTICPVGTTLGFLSRFSIFKIHIDAEKCSKCNLCSCNCKASCINIEEHKIDYSRCVDCMDCIGKCHHHAISYKTMFNKTNKQYIMGQQDAMKFSANSSLRSFLSISVLFAGTTALKAQKEKLDGGLAVIKDKKIPHHATKLTPPGSLSIDNFTKHCTTCQLCISECPNQVLHPSNNLLTLMQPEMSYEKGACRPECTRCSQLCPSGAIKPITREEKSSLQIGHAVWISKNCIVNTDKVSCGNCARHCPNGAIQMIKRDANKPDSPLIPVVNTERCIGCGTCEYVCPARPFSAIYVEGHEVHRKI